ncbi:MAG: hypothetical protein Q8O89_08245 [Nanoarchaeota archaeon]|nr:hypothetical protein [Nanoarchaeota archaeon]
MITHERLAFLPANMPLKVKAEHVRNVGFVINEQIKNSEIIEFKFTRNAIGRLVDELNKIKSEREYAKELISMISYGSTISFQKEHAIENLLSFSKSVVGNKHAVRESLIRISQLIEVEHEAVKKLVNFEEHEKEINDVAFKRAKNVQVITANFEKINAAIRANVLRLKALGSEGEQLMKKNIARLDMIINEFRRKVKPELVRTKGEIAQNTTKLLEGMNKDLKELETILSVQRTNIKQAEGSFKAIITCNDAHKVARMQNEFIALLKRIIILTNGREKTWIRDMQKKSAANMHNIIDVETHLNKAVAAMADMRRREQKEIHDSHAEIISMVEHLTKV